jgi:hypothetical protein
MNRDPDLTKLPVEDVDEDAAKRIHAKARAAFEEEGELRKQPLALAALHRVSRVVFPVALAGAVVIYLTWAVQAANALYP